MNAARDPLPLASPHDADAGLRAALRAVKDLAAAALHVDPATLEDDTPLSAYGVNSVDMIDITVKLETQFDIQFDPEQLAGPSCRSLAAMVQSLRAQQESAR